MATLSKTLVDRASRYRPDLVGVGLSITGTNMNDTLIRIELRRPHPWRRRRRRSVWLRRQRLPVRRCRQRHADRRQGCRRAERRRRFRHRELRVGGQYGLRQPGEQCRLLRRCGRRHLQQHREGRRIEPRRRADRERRRYRARWRHGSRLPDGRHRTRCSHRRHRRRHSHRRTRVRCADRRRRCRSLRVQLGAMVPTSSPISSRASTRSFSTKAFGFLRRLTRRGTQHRDGVAGIYLTRRGSARAEPSILRHR